MLSRIRVTRCPRNVTNVTRVMKIPGCRHWSLAGRRLRLRGMRASAGSRPRHSQHTGDTERAAKIQGGGYRVTLQALLIQETCNL